MLIPFYQLVMDRADLDWFRTHMGSNRCFPVELRSGEQSWSGWIGFRGRYSRQFAKPSFDLWFDRAQPFEGQLQLHLSAAFRDPSLLRSRLAHTIFADLGVPTPRAWHVWLLLNEDAIGLYTAYESMDEAWLRRQGHEQGTIYYGVGGEGNFGLINPKTDRPKRRLLLGYEKCYPADDEMSDLEELIYQVALPDDEEFAEQIDSVLDVEVCLRWLAGITFTSHTDGLAHNYALLRYPGSRWQISPWDCDGTWGRGPDGSRVPPDWLPLGGAGENYLVARLLATERWRSRYLDLLAELLDTTLTPDRLRGHLAPLYQSIRSLALEDGNKAFPNHHFLREPAYIREWTADRITYLQAEIARWRQDPPISADGTPPLAR